MLVDPAILLLETPIALNMIQLSKLAGVAAIAIATLPALGGTIYSTTGLGTEFYGSGTSIANGHRGLEYGDEIRLPSEGYSFTGLSFDYYSASLGGSAKLTLYANDGALINGSAAPGTKLLEVPNIGLSAGLNTATFDYTPFVSQFGEIKLPKAFTVAVSFSGASTTSDKGLLVGGAVDTSGRPNTNVGGSANDFWQRTGSGSGDWALRQLSSGTEANFKIAVTANIPEPTTVALGVVGAAFVGAAALRRNRR